MRARTEPAPADLRPMLEVSLSPRHSNQHCTMLIGERLLQGDGSTPEPSILYFTIHRLLGDIFWMIADDEPALFVGDDDDVIEVVSDDSLAVLHRNLYQQELRCLEDSRS